MFRPQDVLPLVVLPLDVLPLLDISPPGRYAPNFNGGRGINVEIHIHLTLVALNKTGL